MKKLILVVTTKDQLGERSLADVWTTDKETVIKEKEKIEDRAIAKTASHHGLPADKYKELFDPKVWIIDAEMATPLDKS